MGSIVRRATAVLRQHALLILGPLALLAITVILWNFPVWRLTAFAVLQRNLLLVGVLGGSLAILVLLWVGPKWQAARLNPLGGPQLTPRERFDVENEARKTLLQIVGGIGVAAVFAGLYFTWKTLEINQEGQITDRFTKAIAQLGEQGAEKLAVRLGGIYALERIARESEKDFWPIMEVLTAYVRENGRWVQEKGQLPPKLLPDMQAVLTVLGRSSRMYRERQPHPLDSKGTSLRLTAFRLDLRGTNLRAADLIEAHLGSVVLQGAHLEEADLRLSHLEGAELRGAYLKGANLQHAYFDEADFREAHLEGAILESAHLKGAQLQDAHLEGGDLDSANLKGAVLTGAHLEGASLYGTNLEGAILSQARLQGADLSQALSSCKGRWSKEPGFTERSSRKPSCRERKA